MNDMDNGNQQLVPTNGAHGGSMVARQEFGKRELEMRHETAATAVATQAAEMVRARCAMALERPRSWMVVRAKLLEACKRPGFAEAARYSKPMGKKKNDQGKWEQQYVRGFSIRFAEEAIRCMGNIDVETMIKFDNARQRILRIVVLDIESNNAYPSDILVEKTVERRFLREGQTAISQRTNSYGDPVYVVDATEDEMLTKGAALTSKAIRTNAMRLVPGDIQEECEKIIYETASQENAKDPKASLKKLLDRLGAIGVSLDQVAQYLGHPVDSMTSKEMWELTEIGTGIKEGSTSWAEVMEDRAEERTAAPSSGEQEKSAPEAAPKTAADLKAKAQSELAKTKTATPEETAKLIEAEKHVAEQRAKTEQEVKPAHVKAPKREPEPKGIKAKTEAENGHMVDGNDTGPCAFEEEGVVCMREAYRYDGHGYRCGEHAPPPAIK